MSANRQFVVEQRAIADYKRGIRLNQNPYRYHDERYEIWEDTWLTYHELAMTAIRNG